MEVKSALCSVVARKEENRMPYTVSGCHLFSSCRGETKNTITQHDLCVSGCDSIDEKSRMDVVYQRPQSVS